MVRRATTGSIRAGATDRDPCGDGAHGHEHRGRANERRWVPRVERTNSVSTKRAAHRLPTTPNASPAAINTPTRWKMRRIMLEGAAPSAMLSRYLGSSRAHGVRD